jgi:signal transduction histidine kinase/uncharacterized protein HemY
MYPNIRGLIILFIVTLLIFPNVSYAWEDQNFDSNTLSPLEQVYLQQAEACSEDDDLSNAHFYYEQLISEITNRNVQRIPPFIHHGLGTIKIKQFNYDSAFDYFSLVLNNPNSSRELQTKTLSSLARAYSKLGENNLAHEYFIKVIKLREEAGDEEGLIGELYSLGSLFFYQKNYSVALENYNKTLTIAKKYKKNKYIYNATAALGATYEQLGELAQSLKFNAEALRLAEKQNYVIGISYALHNFGTNYAVQDNHEKALEYFARSLSTKEATDKFGQAGDYIAIGNSYLQLKNFTKAEESFENALNLGIEIKAKTRIAVAHEALAKVYKETGELQKENLCLSMYISVKDSMLNEEALKEIGQRKNAYDMARKENEIIVLKSEKEILKAKQRVNLFKNIFWIIAFCTLIVVAIALFINWKKQQKMARLLQEKHCEIEEKNEKIQIQNKLLEQSNLELQNFAYVASHDLKEPLRMVNSFSGLLKRKYNDVLDDRGQEYMYYITDAVDRMGILLDDLLDYSRVNTSDKNAETVNTANVAAKVRMNFTPTLEEKFGDVIINYDRMPEIQGNKSQFGQLLQNLISNGLKFQNGKPPIVEVDCEERKKDYLFSVKDNGIGISKENQAKVFDMFTRLHTREQYNGTGIGLSTCRKIVERHGGEIWLDSEEGHGSTFFFTVSKHL